MPSDKRVCACPRRREERRCRCRGCGRFLALTAAQEAALLLALTHFFSENIEYEDEQQRQRLRRHHGRLKPWTLES